MTTNNLTLAGFPPPDRRVVRQTFERDRTYMKHRPNGPLYASPIQVGWRGTSE